MRLVVHFFCYLCLTTAAQEAVHYDGIMKYSLIIPVYNRPDEVDELLESLTGQTFTDFEVIVVEDGSSCPCRDGITGRNVVRASI